MSFKPGYLLHGRFRLKQVIGRGGMGEIWEADDERTSKVVAVKTLRESALLDPDLVVRFEREIDVMERLSQTPCAHIVQLISAAHQPIPYMAIERMFGFALEERLHAEHVLAPAELHSIVKQIFLGLEAAHALGIVHRDLKPSNVLLAMHGAATVVRLVDFGVAKLLGEDLLTTEGSTVGSISYSAPEQIVDASAVDARADLYAVGTILYRAVSGKLPFAEKNVARLVALKRDFEAPVLEARVPDSVKAFTAALLARDPKKRPRSAREALSLWETIPVWGPYADIAMDESTATYAKKK